MVAPRSAPHSSSAAITASPRPWRRCSGATSMLRKPTQSSAYAATPLARSPSRTVTTSPSSSYDASSGDGEAAPRAPGDDRGDLEERVGVVALRHPAVAAEERVLGGVGQHGGDRPAGSRRVERDDPLESPSTPDGATASTELARRAVEVGEWRSSQSPSGSVSRSGPQRERPALRRQRGDPVPGRRGGAGPACRRRCRRARSSTARAGLRLRRRRCRRPTTTQVPSRSVRAGPPLGPVSPRSTRRTTTRCPTTWGPSMCLVTS